MLVMCEVCGENKEVTEDEFLDAQSEPVIFCEVCNICRKHYDEAYWESLHGIHN